MTANRDASWEKDFQSCVNFHGHACPGLAIGYLAATAGMAWLKERKAEDEEIVAIVETDACGCDAVQVITGCTFGKGNFIFKDYGKTAFSFLSRTSGKALRLILKHNSLSMAPEHKALFERIHNETAEMDDIERFRDLQRQRTIEVLQKPPGDLFNMQEISSTMPPRARVSDSLVCSGCGESVMASKLTQTTDGLLCTPCMVSRKKGD